MGGAKYRFIDGCGCYSATDLTMASNNMALRIRLRARRAPPDPKRPHLRRKYIEYLESVPVPTLPIPLLLQDLCLLTVMNYLRSYPRNMLASSPLWLHHRLLNVIPTLDLCQLEHTSVADGIDVDVIWKRRWHGSRLRGDIFQLNVFDSLHSLLEEEMEPAFKDIDQRKLSCSENFLLDFLSDFLAPKNLANERDLHQLVSVKGNFLLSNLPSGSMLIPSEVSEYHRTVWKNQPTALTVSLTQRCQEEVYLTPHHFLSLFNENCFSNLSSFLVGFDLQPSSACIEVNFIYHLMYHEILGSCCTEKQCWTSIFSHLLRKVKILRLKCSDYSEFAILVWLVEAAMKNLDLKYLFCAIPNLYLDVIQPLSSLFSLQNFYYLRLTVQALSPHSSLSYYKVL